MQRLINLIRPFFILGLLLVIAFFVIVFLAHLFILGAVVGFVLFALAWLRQKFFPSKHTPQATPKSGRIIDSNDWKEL